jgi:hypothetical protein
VSAAAVALRKQLEAEVRAAFDEARANGNPTDSLLLVGNVLERHQHRAEVRDRLEFLWTYLEAYVAFLETQG